MKMHLLFDDITVLNQFHAQIVQMHLQERVHQACSIKKQVKQKIHDVFMKSPLPREVLFALVSETQKEMLFKSVFRLVL